LPEIFKIRVVVQDARSNQSTKFSGVWQYLQATKLSLPLYWSGTHYKNRRTDYCIESSWKTDLETNIESGYINNLFSDM
jgi:hypothetical protein